MMPSRRVAGLASVVTVNNKTAVQNDDIPFTTTEEKHDQHIYLTITF